MPTGKSAVKFARESLSCSDPAFLSYLVRQREIKKFKTTPQLYCVELIKADHLISAEGISSGVFAYTMSAVDQSGAFGGADETDIKNGYGLRSEGLHQSSILPYSHDPVWEREDDDEELRKKEKCYVYATADSYLVITLMSKNTLNDQVSYLGQTIVRLADHEKELYHDSPVEDRSSGAWRKHTASRMSTNSKYH